MYIQHHISSYQCEILENSEGTAHIKVNGNFNGYQQADFNHYLAIQSLIASKLVDKLTIKEYATQHNNYLYNKAKRLPLIPYTGKLADDYTFLQLETGKLGLYVGTATTTQQLQDIIAAIQPFFSEEQINSCNLEHKALHFMISVKSDEILKTIQKELNTSSEIRTLQWKRKLDAEGNEIFDYSLPATLFLGTVAFDEKEYKKLLTIAEKIVKNCSITPSAKEPTSSVFIKIDYQNIAAKVKK
jgi:hypothetical protein